VEFARSGIRTYGVDASPEMVRLARRKARSEAVPVRVLLADMRSFRLPEPVDLVTCEFDALNHVPHKSDLDRVARAVARALRPGGWFFFDVNNRAAFEKVWTGTWRQELPGVVLVMHGGYERHRGKGWSNAEWFIRRGKCWRRSMERVEAGSLDSCGDPPESAARGVQCGPPVGPGALRARMENPEGFPHNLSSAQAK